MLKTSNCYTATVIIIVTSYYLIPGILSISKYGSPFHFFNLVKGQNFEPL